MSNIVKGSGLLYTTGIPNTIPSTAHDSEFAIDINGNQYAWNRTTSVWDNLGQGIEIATSSIAPTHVPSKFRPRFVITPQRKLYFYSGSWGQVNAPDGLYTAVSNYYPSIAVDVEGSGVAPTYYVYLNQNGATDGQALVWSDADSDWVPGTVGGTSGPTGIYSGSGVVPDGTVATLSGSLTLNYSNENQAMYIQPDAVVITADEGGTVISMARGFFVSSNFDNMGIQYDTDYSATIKENDRSIPDVGTVKQIARPYKVYTALLSQSGTDDPVATVRENTLSGTPVWTRNDVGQYIGTLVGEFTTGKTTVSISPEIFSESSSDIYTTNIQFFGGNSVQLYSYYNYAYQDDVLGNITNFVVEIRVYP